LEEVKHEQSYLIPERLETAQSGIAGEGPAAAFIQSTSDSDIRYDGHKRANEHF
jgi:hypothetical protein